MTLTYISAPSRRRVPEAGTWAMMVGGFGLVGGAMRRAPARQDRLRLTRGGAPPIGTSAAPPCQHALTATHGSSPIACEGGSRCNRPVIVAPLTA